MARFREGAVLKERYVLGQRLGRGGMAAVWLGQDLVLDRPVAVKVLSEAIASDRTFATRFRREATLAARLSHPNLVRIYDYSESDERPYLVMEFLPGEDLGRRIARDLPIDRDELARELLGAVAHMHDFGIIHRDIKPHNVIVADDSTIKLIDFGIALPPDATALTQAGLVLATRRYAAPEVLAGEPAGVRSDLYSCGILLDSCIGPASPALRRLIGRLTNQQPGDRPPSAGAALAELEPPAAPDQATEPFRPAFVETHPDGRPAAERRAASSPARTYSRRRSNRTRWLVATTMVLVAAAVLAIAVTSTGGGASGRQAQAGKGDQKAGSRTGGGPKRPEHDRTSTASEGTIGSVEEGTASSEEDAESREGEAPPSEVDSGQSGGTGTGGDPATGIALNQEGFELIQAGDYGAAVPILEKAVSSFPGGSEELDYGYALFNLGDALLRSGRAAEAVPILERRLRIPDQIETVERELAAARQEAEALGE